MNPKIQIKKGYIFDINRDNNQVVFVLKNIESNHHLEIETEMNWKSRAVDTIASRYWYSYSSSSSLCISGR